MKVLSCPKCKVSPIITQTEFKCPKCGNTAKGSNLAECVSNWNSERFTAPAKTVQVVDKDIDAIKEEIQEEPVKVSEAELKKTERKPAKKSTKKPTKKGAK